MDEPAPTPEEVLRAQELIVTSSVKTHKVKKTVKDDYTVVLDNATKSKADIILKNKGQKTLELTRITLKDPSKLFTLDKEDCGTELSSNQECTLKVGFTGTKAGDYAAKIEVISNDQRHRITNIALKAVSANKFHGQVEKIASTKTVSEKTISLNFNALDKQQLIQITNSGIGKLQLQSPKIVGPDRRNFSYKIECPSVLAVGESCEVTVNYDASAKEGYSDASLILPSNGIISPSKNIQLVGFSKPFTIETTDFVVSKNVMDFMDDYFTSKKTYYFRTIYQKKTDRFFKQNIKDEITKYFKANNFNVASSADKADKIVTIYPTITVTKNEQTNDITYNIVMNGFVTTKSKYLNGVKVGATDATLNNSIGYDVKTEETSFSALTANNLFFQKEEFEFGMGLQINNAPNDKDVAQSVADIVVSKLFNVLGLEDTKGNN